MGRSLQSFSGFQREVKKFQRDTRKEAVQTQVALCTLGLRELMAGSPWDRGHFRQNWFVGIGHRNLRENRAGLDRLKRKIALTTLPPLRGHGDQWFQQQRAELAKLRRLSKVYLTNKVIYGPRLEQGHSKQASLGVVGPVFQRMRIEANARSNRRLRLSGGAR